MRRVAMAGLLALTVCIAAVAAAQEELPQIAPGEKKVARKKEAGPRALAVLQLAASGKASLVPIAILIDGKFWDATAYKADPVPMALESGTVYEGERSGNSLGLFTVGSALHSNNANAQAPWIGTGAWRPVGTEPVNKPMQAEAAPVGIDAADERPRLTRDPSRLQIPASGSKPSAPTAAEKPASDQPTSGGASGSGDGPPRLTKGAPPASAEPAADSPPAKAGEAKAGESKADQKASLPASDSGASETSRPRLRRGVPAASFADEEVPGYSRPGVKTAASSAPLATASAAQGEIQLIPAISDAAGPAPRSFMFAWLKDEEGDRRKQMTTLAKEQLRAFLDARAKSSTTAAPKGSVAAKRAAKPVEPILENTQMIAYDLWNSNQPVLLFSADAHMPAPSAGNGAADSSLSYSVLLVAYPDIYNNLHKLHFAVTDKYHLDVTPRLELIDAIDADGDGRGELLFRETSDVGSGWVLYRATADKLWKMFDSQSR